MALPRAGVRTNETARVRRERRDQPPEKSRPTLPPPRIVKTFTITVGSVTMHSTLSPSASPSLGFGPTATPTLVELGQAHFWPHARAAATST